MPKTNREFLKMNSKKLLLRTKEKEDREKTERKQRENTER
jgi:hypothetical protein